MKPLYGYEGDDSRYHLALEQEDAIDSLKGKIEGDIKATNRSRCHIENLNPFEEMDLIEAMRELIDEHFHKPMRPVRKIIDGHDDGFESGANAVYRGMISLGSK